MVTPPLSTDHDPTETTAEDIAALDAFLTDGGDLFDHLTEATHLKSSPVPEPPVGDIPDLDFSDYHFEDRRAKDLTEEEREEIRNWPGFRFDLDTIIEHGRLQDASDTLLAEVLRCNRRTINIWRSSGFNSRTADRLAKYIGYVPQLLWPNYLEVIEMEELRRLVSAYDADKKRNARRSERDAKARQAAREAAGKAAPRPSRAA